jgi:signal peptidase
MSDDGGGPPGDGGDREGDRTEGDVPWRSDDEQRIEPDRPSPEPTPADEPGGLRWLLTTDQPVVATVREVGTSVLAVVVIGLVLFGVSGVWPPLVAVESGSMEPHMSKGDLVFVVENGRFAGQGAAAGTGVVTHRTGTETGYWSFGDHGNVVVYQPNGGRGTPIIHRAQFYVEEGDNWVAQGDRELAAGRTCAELSNCPADHAGFVTKGDNNRFYDQAVGRSDVVKPEWVSGVSKVRVPLLGCVRLQLSGDSCLG